MNDIHTGNDAAKTVNAQPGFDSEPVLKVELDAELQQALSNFKASMHAWSEAAYTRPRTVTPTVRQRSWRLAAGWALGCALIAGSVSGELVERHHRMEVARIAAEQQAAAQLKIEAQQASAKVPDAAISDPGSSDEVLLAGVDSDVSRQVPSAMEPLAQMMQDDEVK